MCNYEMMSYVSHFNLNAVTLKIVYNIYVIKTYHLKLLLVEVTSNLQNCGLTVISTVKAVALKIVHNIYEP